MKFKLTRLFFVLSTLSFLHVHYYFYPKPKNESKYNGSTQDITHDVTKYYNGSRLEVLSRAETGSEVGLSKWMMKMEKRFSQRAAMVKSACEKYNVQSPSTIALQYGPFQKVTFDTYFKLGYCAIGKVASTTVSNQLKKLMTTKERPNRFNEPFSKHWILEQMPKFFKIPGPLVQWTYKYKMDSSYSIIVAESRNIINFIDENKYLLFTFVRHPFERIISAYKEKVLAPHYHVPRYVDPKFKSMLKKRNAMSFADFIDVIIQDHQNGETTPNGHWNTFSNMCMHCTIPYEVIGQVETFNEDFKYIILKLGLQNILKIEEIETWKNNKSDYKKDKKKEISKYFSQLTKAKFEELWKIYRLDFEMFGYNVTNYYDIT